MIWASSRENLSSGFPQTGLRRLIYAFVVRIWYKQFFSWRGSYNTPQQNHRLGTVYVVHAMSLYPTTELSMTELKTGCFLQMTGNTISSKTGTFNQINRLLDVTPWIRCMTQIYMPLLPINMSGQIISQHRTASISMSNAKWPITNTRSMKEADWNKWRSEGDTKFEPWDALSSGDLDKGCALFPNLLNKIMSEVIPEKKKKNIYN